MSSISEPFFLSTPQRENEAKGKRKIFYFWHGTFVYVLEVAVGPARKGLLLRLDPRRQLNRHVALGIGDVLRDLSLSKKTVQKEGIAPVGLGVKKKKKKASTDESKHRPHFPSWLSRYHVVPHC